MNNTQNKNITNQDYDADQTSFSAEEPLFETASVPAAPVDPNVELVEKESFVRTKMFKTGVGIGSVVALVLVVMIAMLFTRQQPDQVILPSPSPTLAPVSDDPIQQRINALSQDVLAADPADDELPLPPVDLEISLEE